VLFELKVKIPLRVRNPFQRFQGNCEQAITKSTDANGGDRTDPLNHFEVTSRHLVIGQHRAHIFVGHLVSISFIICSAHFTASDIAHIVAGTRLSESYEASFRAARRMVRPLFDPHPNFEVCGETEHACLAGFTYF